MHTYTYTHIHIYYRYYYEIIVSLKLALKSLVQWREWQLIVKELEKNKPIGEKPCARDYVIIIAMDGMVANRCMYARSRLKKMLNERNLIRGGSERGV